MAEFLGDDPDDLLSGLPEGVVDDSIRAIDADIKTKNNNIEKIEIESKDLKDRMAVMVEHLKNVQQELGNTQQLIEAKTKEVETEDHLKQLAERETGRLLQDIAKSERAAFELQDRLNITQNSIFRGNERMDAFKLQMNWNQEEIEQWAMAAKQKEEDNMALQKYSRADEIKIKEMNLNIEKLTRLTGTREAELEAEMTETQSAQIELDKTAADFKKSHGERQDLVAQWEQAIETMRRRDEAINAAREALVTRRQDVDELRRQLDEKRKFLEEQIAENDGVDKAIADTERSVQKLKGVLQNETQARQDLQDEVEVVRSTLSKVAAELSLKRTMVANSRDALSARKDRLEAARRKQAETKKRLEDEYLATNDLEKSAQQIEELNREQERALKSMEKEVAVLKQDMFKHSQELFALRKEEANLIAEISGAQTADRNLRDKVRSLDAESQKQEEHIYSADFQLQQMERKVARAQGEYRADEKEALNAKVAQLEKVLGQADEEERLLKKQLKVVHDDYRRAKRNVEELVREKSGLDERIQELHLGNDVVSRSLRNAVKAKDEGIVHHDLLRLEVKKLRDKLSERADQVHGLENRNFQLLKSMRERAAEVKAQKEILRADLKMAQEELHAAVMELKDREMRQATLQNKLDLLVDKMKTEMGSSDERKSPAYYVVLRAQEREELQKQGDELDGRIQKAEKEIRALENTLAKLTAKNDRLRLSFGPGGGGGGGGGGGSAAEVAARQEVEAKVERLMDRRRAKKAEAGTLAQDLAEMRQRLAGLQAEEEGLRRHVRLLQTKAVQFDKEREELEQKRQRAEASLARAAAAHRQARGAGPRDETPVERDFRLQALKEENKTNLYAIVALGEENPELGPMIEAALRDAGLAPPSRPMSVRSSVSSAASET